MPCFGGCCGTCCEEAAYLFHDTQYECLDKIRLVYEDMIMYNGVFFSPTYFKCIKVKRKLLLHKFWKLGRGLVSKIPCLLLELFQILMQLNMINLWYCGPVCYLMTVLYDPEDEMQDENPGHMRCNQANWVWSQKIRILLFWHFLFGYSVGFNLWKQHRDTVIG